MNGAALRRLLEEGLRHHQAGRLAEGEGCYRRARALAPQNFDVLQLSGILAYQQRRWGDAVALLTKALWLQPQSGLCEMRLGLALMGLGRPSEGEQRLRAVVAREPTLVEAWENLAVCLKLQDRLEEAIQAQRRVVELRAEDPLAWSNLGLSLSSAGRVSEGLACQERACALAPALTAARFGRAQALQQNHRLAEAIAEYEAVIASAPGHLGARSYRLFALHYVEGISQERLYAEHVAFGRAVGPAASGAMRVSARPGGRLRVAFLSPDLRLHACAFFIEPILRHLPADQFEIFLYMDHFREDDVSARLRGFAAQWRNFVARTDAEVEEVIRGDAPDVLVDLAGHTGMGNRLALFARRLAPVQVTYLGYPDTTGAPGMDYRLTDEVADPAPEADRWATEKLIRFAPTAWAYQPPSAAGGAAGGAARTPALTFGCFNHPDKITDRMLGVWGRLLARVPAARLCLKGPGFADPAVRERYAQRLAAAGIAGERVTLLERTATIADHLSLYAQVDVALDCFPYHGTTTTCEALWMGVPVVTLRGDRHASRVGASLLAAVGRTAWIAASEDEYVEIAAGLAADAPLRATLRSALREEMSRSALLDHPAQAARFGAALWACWRSRSAAPASVAA